MYRKLHFILGTKMDFHLDSLLNLSNTTVFTIHYDTDFICLHLQLDNDGISCPNCHNYTDNLHDTNYILVRDLSVFGYLVYLRVPRRKFYCSHCQRYPTEVLNWVEKRRGFTCRYENYIYEQVKQLTVEQVSVQEKLSPDQVQRIFSRRAKQELAKKDWNNPVKLSLDEFSRQKGKGNLVTVVTDLEKSSLLEVINSHGRHKPPNSIRGTRPHKSDEIIEVLKQQPEAIRAKVEEVCVDMWGGFPKVIKAVFQNAAIVIDRFHVMKLVNKSLNKIRLKLGLTGLKNKLLLLKNYEDLSELESSGLAQLFQKSSVLEIAYGLKEELRQIYEGPLTVKAGIKKIKQWLIYARLILGSVADTLKKYLPEIANYFRHKTTSGVTEGINTKIKLILRQSYGFTDFARMREKLLACLFKLSLQVRESQKLKL